MDQLNVQPGTRIGAFEVESVLGSGTMGVVVAARHVERGESVAIKIMHSPFTRDPQVRERFLREGATARALTGEHIVRVMDVGVLRTGQPYIVMERLAGFDLDALLEARGPLPAPFVVDVTLQACAALAEAHDAGVVHRDLKPSNFFLTERPDSPPIIKILDFGIAKTDMFRGQELTTVATTLGSPPYMSPEQIKSSMSVDRRADIWSLGVTMFELLTGELPFSGDSLGAIAGAILRDPPLRIEELKPDVEPRLAAVIARCLTKDRDERYAGVDEIAAELRAIADSLPSPEPPEPPDSTTRPHSTRRFRRGTESRETLVFERRPSEPPPAPSPSPSLAPGPSLARAQAKAAIERVRESATDLQRFASVELRKLATPEVQRVATPLVTGVIAGIVVALLLALLIGLLVLVQRC